MAKKPKPPRGPQLELAGNLGVAFVNTASAREWNFQQGFQTYAELLTWGQQAGVLDGDDAERLRRLAAVRPEDAEAVAARAVKLRSGLLRIFVAILRDEDPEPADLETLSAALAAAAPAVRVVPGDSGLTLGWGGDGDALDRMLWAATHSAVELLISLDGPSRIRQCARNSCTLFFVPGNARRKFCNGICRDRDKALRYYHLHVRDKRAAEMHGGGHWRVKRPRKRKFS